MSVAISPVNPPAPATTLVAGKHSFWRSMCSKKLTVVCMIIVAAYILAGVLSFVPLIERLTAQPIGGTYDPPKFSIHPSEWLGTDILGRSVLWRTIYGTRTALLITVGAGTISVIIGAILGIVAGYFGGWVDALIVWLFTTISSVPWILLVVAIAFALQGFEFANGETIKDRWGDLPAIICALGLTDWVGSCRLLRGEVFKHRSADYVQAARAMGLGTPRILFRHILPNVMHLIIITFSLASVGYVQAEVVLTFIGIGINDKPSWGRMITDAKLEVLRGVWWQLASATVAIFVICWALNIVGDALRDAMDPKERGRS